VTAHTEVLRRRAAAELTVPAPVAVGRPRVRSWLVFALAVVIAFFGLIFSRISLDRSAFVLEDLEVQISQEEARLGDLRVEVARLRSPERISRLAEEMGFVYPAERVGLRLPAPPQDITSQYQWAQSRSSPTAHP
jgi:cell division protein FtsL